MKTKPEKYEKSNGPQRNMRGISSRGKKWLRHLTVLDNMRKSRILRIFEQNSVLHQARMSDRGERGNGGKGWLGESLRTQEEARIGESDWEGRG